MTVIFPSAKPKFELSTKECVSDSSPARICLVRSHKSESFQVIISSLRSQGRAVEVEPPNCFARCCSVQPNRRAQPKAKIKICFMVLIITPKGIDVQDLFGRPSWNIFSILAAHSRRPLVVSRYARRGSFFTQALKSSIPIIKSHVFQTTLLAMYS